MKEDADGVEAKLLGPAELTVNGDGVEALRLPHLELRGSGEELESEWNIQAQGRETWLMAVEGMKLQPTIQGRLLYQLKED